MITALFHIVYNIVIIPMLALAYAVLALVNRKASDRFRHTHRSHEALESLTHARSVIWFHAASMGEFEQAKPVIEVLKNRSNPPEIVVTFSSPSGYNPNRNYPHADAVMYLPFDSWLAQRRFIQRMRPSACVVIRYDLWWNMSCILRSRSIPLFLINATASRSEFLRRWPLRHVYDALLSRCALIVAADENEASELGRRSHADVVCGGDTRYDRICAVVDSPLPSEHWFDACSGEDDVVLVLGSVWSSDVRSLELSDETLQRLPCLRLIIVPHEIDEHSLAYWQGIFTQCKRLTELRATSASSRHVLVDTMGELLHVYRYADIVYVGGGFGAGVHSLAEAAAYGVPVACGPRLQKSADAARLMKHGGCGILNGPAALDAWLDTQMQREERKRVGQANGMAIRTSSGWHEKTAAMILQRIAS